LTDALTPLRGSVTAVGAGLCLWMATCFLTAMTAGAIQGASSATTAAKAKLKTTNPSQSQPASGGFDQLIADIDQDKDAEKRLQRYFDLAGNEKAPATVRQAASAKWQGLLNQKLAASALIQGHIVSGNPSPADWNEQEKAFQTALAAFPTAGLRTAYGNSLVARADYEVDNGNLTAAATLCGRAQELGADQASLQAARQRLKKKEQSWGGAGWAGIKKYGGLFWKGLVAIIGSAHVWALIGIVFAIWFYRQVRGDSNDYQFEPFIVVQQRDADGKDKIYPGLTARLIKEMKRVAEIHQGRSRRALDEISDPLGNSVPINFTEYEPELTSKIEQIPEISVGAFKLPLVASLGILLRIKVKHVRTYYEEFSKGNQTYLRLMADLRGIRVLGAEAQYQESEPPSPAVATTPAPASPPPQRSIWDVLLSRKRAAQPSAAQAVADNSVPSFPAKADVLDRLMTALACEIRYSRITEQSTRSRSHVDQQNEAYSQSADVYREFTLGLDAQHAAAQMMQAATSSPGTLAVAQARMNVARLHYDHVLSMQSDHAAAFFCRAGISLQDAQILKRSASYKPDTPEDVAAFDKEPARTRIDDAIDDYRMTVRYGRTYLRGLSYFNLANIFYRIHRCDAYELALDYADQAETAFNQALSSARADATELLRRVWLLKISILVDKAAYSDDLSSHKRGTPAGEIDNLISRYRAEDSSPLMSEYWRVSAKINLMKIKDIIEASENGNTTANSLAAIRELLDEATKCARQAVELDPGVAENHNTLGSVHFVRLRYLQGEGRDKEAAFILSQQQSLAAYTRACSLSTHEYMFYNRAIFRKNFVADGSIKAAEDFKRACATIANYQRSSIALFSYGELLESSNSALSNKFKSVAALDVNFSRPRKDARPQEVRKVKT
jgi:hypothetical protein